MLIQTIDLLLNAASGRHVGFGNNFFATGISSSGNVSSLATGVTSAFDGQDVEKLTKIFCAGFLGWKPAWDYKRGLIMLESG